MSTPTLQSPARVPVNRSAPPRTEPVARPVRPLRRTDFVAAREPVGARPRAGGLREFTHHPSEPADAVQASAASRLSAPRAGGTDPLGDPTALCCAVAHAAMESLRGIRPLAQLVRSVSPEVFDALHTRCQVTAQARTRPGQPEPSQSRSRVRRARVVRIAPGIAEATVIVDDVDRVRAAAVRVEEHRGRWWVVVLEIG